MENLYKNEIYISDLDRIISSSHEMLKSFENKSILITGASGLICSSVVDLLFRYNETKKNKINLYLAGRNEERMKNRFSKYVNSSFFHFIKYDATSKNTFNIKPDYIIHGAGNSSPSAFSEYPVETMVGFFLGLKELLDLAVKEKTNRVLFISSSEIYCNAKSEKAFIEDDMGFAKLLDFRSAYPIGKMASETLCCAYSKEYRVDFVIARPGHIYGPTVTPEDNHVSSLFIRQAASGIDLVMKSEGQQIRSYVYMLDTASAILTILAKGEAGQAYNISNRDSIISIRDMAEIIARNGNVKFSIEKPEEKEFKAFNPMVNSSLNASKLEKLGWKGLFNSEEGFNHSIKILRSLLYE